jgi:hypothetical protein
MFYPFFYETEIVFIDSNKRVTKPPTMLNIYPAKSNNVSRTQTILGTNARVCSFICVVAWNIETSSPTTIATISIGAAHNITVVIACVNKPITSPSVINTVKYLRH